MSLFAELNRRNVFRVALLYIVLGWFILQLIELILMAVGSGGWIYRFAFALGIICFPLALIFAYIFEITPHGLKKEHQVERIRSITRRTGRKIKNLTLGFLGLAVALEIIILVIG
jgi:adenylate cyclase